MKSKSRPVALLAVTFLALIPMGCSSPTESVVENAIENAIGEEADVDVDVDGDGGISIESEDGSVQIGSGAEFPADFPSGVPVPNGTLNGTFVTQDNWSLTYSGISRAEFDRLIDEAASSGFEVIYTSSADDTVQTAYSRDDFTLTFVWDGSEANEQTLVYSVLKTSD